jgi:hypothetical protein
MNHISYSKRLNWKNIAKYKVIDLGLSFPRPVSLPQLEFRIKHYSQDTLTGFYSLTAFQLYFSFILSLPINRIGWPSMLNFCTVGFVS